ncbi:EpsG family protein [Aliiroseovarius sp. 2305UL8-7]|uniref:EpsG family protein n=1 Tax=Aliiroseovarius conchicola TaxID=3121637 RepID=UPI0035299596
MIYLAIFVLLGLLRLCLAGQPRLRDHSYFFVLLGLFLFVAFRLEVGCDWNGYQRHYRLQLGQDLTDAMMEREPLWWALTHLVGRLGLGYPWLNVASAGIFFAGVHTLARRQPDRLGFLILLYPVLIINMPMSGIRQAAAIGVMCAGFVAFTCARPKSFVIYTLIATGLHISAGVFLLLAPLVGKDWIKARLVAAFLLAGPGITMLLAGDGAQLAVARYVNTGVDAHGALYRAGLLGATAVLFFLVLRGPWLRQYPKDIRLVNLAALMMLAILQLIVVSSVIADRIGYYLVPVQAMMLARMPFLDLGRSKAVLSTAPYAVLLVMLAVWTSQSTHFRYCYLPYDSWLFGMPDFYRFPN